MDGIDKFQFYQLREKYNELGKAHVEVIKNNEMLNNRITELNRLLRIAYPIMAIEKYNKYMDNDYSLIDWQNDASKELSSGL